MNELRKHSSLELNDVEVELRRRCCEYELLAPDGARHREGRRCRRQPALARTVQGGQAASGVGRPSDAPPGSLALVLHGARPPHEG